MGTHARYDIAYDGKLVASAWDWYDGQWGWRVRDLMDAVASLPLSWRGGKQPAIKVLSHTDHYRSGDRWSDGGPQNLARLSRAQLERSFWAHLVYRANYSSKTGRWTFYIHGRQLAKRTIELLDKTTNMYTVYEYGPHFKEHEYDD